MPTLKQILEAQHPGVRQNPYKYKIVCILDIYAECSSDDITIKEARNEKIYLNIEDIPEKYYDHFVYNIEPDRDESTGCMYLKIVLL